MAEYTYTPEGLRSKKTVNGGVTRYLYDGANICAEIVSDGTAYTYYRADGIIGSIHGDEKLYYEQTSRGDVSVVYDTTGNIVKSNAYSPYGERETVRKINETNDPLRLMWVAEIEKIHIPFGYCGEYFDDETGLIYLRNRYYDPTIGRFITEDPIRDGVNWYVYAGNNPINFVDFWGLEYIVVSGSEHNTLADRRYKYNFIEPAIKKLTELKQLNDGENITWLVSSTGYSDEDISNFTETAANLGVNICFFADKTEFLSYINEKSVPGGTAYRDADKIKKIAVFSHGLKGSIEFGYHQLNQSELSLKYSDILKLRSGAFDNPNSCFYSCNTGTSDKNGSSFAQSW